MAELIGKITLHTHSGMDRIAQCSKCAKTDRLAHLNSEERRRKRCVDATNWAPDSSIGVRIVYLGEAPPSSGKYVYDLGSPLSNTPDSLARRVKDDLEKRGEIHGQYGSKDFELADKKEFLTKLRSMGIVIIDCCQCALLKEDPKETRAMLKACFAEQTLPILNHIREMNEAIEIRPVYGSVRKILTRKASREVGIVDTWTFTPGIK